MSYNRFAASGWNLGTNGSVHAAIVRDQTDRKLDRTRLPLLVLWYGLGVGFWSDFTGGMKRQCGRSAMCLQGQVGDKSLCLTSTPTASRPLRFGIHPVFVRPNLHDTIPL